MRQSGSANWLEDLKRRPQIDGLQPIAIRLIFSLRLIAVHRKVRRDPVPELATRLGDLSLAIGALELVETLGAIWPEPIQVSRVCCQCLTHDEVTLGAAIEGAAARDREAFVAQLQGLIRPHRIDMLWEQCLSMVAADHSAARYL